MIAFHVLWKYTDILKKYYVNYSFYAGLYCISKELVIISSKLVGILIESPAKVISEAGSKDMSIDCINYL